MSIRDEVAVKLIPFGPYRGLTLAQVLPLPGGEEYLAGLLKERWVGAPLKEAVQLFLRECDPPVEPDRSRRV